MKRYKLLLLTFLTFLAYRLDACPVCATGKEEARQAYYATTALMSFVPLLFIGGVVYFIMKKYRGR